MIRLPRKLRNRFPIVVLAMVVVAVPVRSSDLAEQPLSLRERKVLDEYRLHCRPGRFIEDVKANLHRMQQRHQGSTFLKDSDRL